MKGDQIMEKEVASGDKESEGRRNQSNLSMLRRGRKAPVLTEKHGMKTRSAKAQGMEVEVSSKKESQAVRKNRAEWNLEEEVVKGIGNVTNVECPFCKSGNETIDHHFLHCDWSRALWIEVMRWWDVNWCHNRTFLQWKGGWEGLCPAAKHDRASYSLFYAVVWTTWEVRNKLVFEGKKTMIEQAIDMVKFRVVWWFKHCGKGSMVPITSLLLNIKELYVETKCVKKFGIEDWIPPMMGKFKFNVDDSFRGKLRPVRIGGVLRASKGRRFVYFHRLLGTKT
ncbi:hypothetical protein Dsin_005952 [Dipteronia sinensis]|uniref:Reverse transcriptase zinc-binding domain-containing protein n=1 Tax=Dipteronia sinensis TaxID=43782 RepID=A0AAE0EGZ3_9ROSI|nr:hypothetical protein Dsin_005952 [Dipteronia sinensis]